MKFGNFGIVNRLYLNLFLETDEDFNGNRKVGLKLFYDFIVRR